jgi:hypothetical protein
MVDTCIIAISASTASYTPGLRIRSGFDLRDALPGSRGAPCRSKVADRDGVISRLHPE